MTDVAKVNIVNTALFQLGQEPVPDLTDASLTSSVAAVKLLRVIDQARDDILSRQGWLCAMQYVTLSPVIIPGYVNWKYPVVYQLPGDGLRVWQIAGYPLTEYYSMFWRQRWELGTIDTDMGPLKIIRSCDDSGSIDVAYTRRASWGALSEHVAMAVAFDTAALAAVSVTGDANLAKKLDADAEGRVRMALSTEAMQEEGQTPIAPSIPEAIRNYSR